MWRRDSTLPSSVAKETSSPDRQRKYQSVGRPRSFDQEALSKFYEKRPASIQQQKKRRILMMTQVDRNEVKRLISQGAQLVEVLPKAEYEQEHLPGAINIFLKHLDRKSAAQLSREQPVIVYCHDYQ